MSNIRLWFFFIVYFVVFSLDFLELYPITNQTVFFIISLLGFLLLEKEGS